MSININLKNYNIVDDSELEFSSSFSTNKLVDNLINKPINDSINNSINKLIENNTKNKYETIIELPMKKKKGRKSKKNKELELSQEKQVVKARRFPKLSEKIFDVLKINNIEYYYDTDFNLLLDATVEPVGFKYDKKFVFYSEINDTIYQIKKDDEEVKLIISNYKN